MFCTPLGNKNVKDKLLPCHKKGSDLQKCCTYYLYLYMYKNIYLDTIQLTS